MKLAAGFDKEDDVSKWHGVSVDAEGRVSQLKFIDSGLSSLTERLGELKTLQTLNLTNCTGLVSLPDRLGELETLQTLNLGYCSGLVSLPERLGELKTLQTLNLERCTGLVSLPERLGELKTLQTLDLDYCTGLVSLPDLSGLAQLEVRYLPDHLQPWKASGYKAFSLSNEA